MILFLQQSFKRLYKNEEILQYNNLSRKKLNLFTSSVTLRYDLDPDYQTFTGGCLTILLFALFFSIFLPVGIEVLNKDKIQTKFLNIKQNDPSYLQATTNELMFALGFQGSNMNNPLQKRYFDVNMVKVSVINSTKTTQKLKLQQCTLSHWSPFGQQFTSIFQTQSLSSFLCPPLSLPLQFSGKFTSPQFLYYKISLDTCTGLNCATITQIQSFITQNTLFKFNFFYTNILINPQQKSPITYFLEDKDYLVFSDKLGTHTNLYVGEVQIMTDESLYPWSQKNQVKKFVVDRSEKENWNYQKTAKETYAKLFIRKSDTKIKVERSFTKIDQFLSYIGGLFGLITIVFSLIMNYYGQCSFQLQLCQQIFDYTTKDRKQSKNKISDNDDDMKSNSMIIANQTKSQNQQSNHNKNQDIIEPESFLDF